MTLDRIYTALADAIHGGTIDLIAAATGDLAGLAVPLGRLRLADQFMVADAALIQPVNQVLLRGTARYGLPGAAAAGSHVVAVGVSLAVTIDEAGAAGYALTLALPPQTWRFSDTFAGLPQTQRLASDKQTIELGDSFLIDLPLQDATLLAVSTPDTPVALAGGLPRTGVFAQRALADLFPGRWPLAARGTVILPASYDAPPDIDMLATVGGSTLPFGGSMLVDLGFELLAQTGFDVDDYGYTAVSNLFLTGKVRFDAQHSLRLVVAILAVQNTWRLLVEAEPDTIRIGDQIGRVAALLGLTVEDLISPDTLDTFNAFYLSSIEIWLPAFTGSLVDGIGVSAFDISNIGVTLLSDRVWNPPIPFVKVVDTGVSWNVGWMPGAGGASKMYTFGSVFGGLKVGLNDEQARARVSDRSLPLLSGPDPAEAVAPRPYREPVQEVLAPLADDPALADSFTVDLTAYIPSFVIEGRLRTNEAIPIGYAFNQFFGNPGPPTKDQMRVTDFAFTADPRALTFQAQAVVTMDWSIPFTSAVSLDLLEVRFNIDVRQSSVGGSISGLLQLTGGASGDAQPQFTVSATYVPSTRAGEWTFRGFLNQNAPLELTTLVANLLDTTPPSNLPMLDVERMAIEFKSTSQAYNAEGAMLARWKFAPFGTELTVSATAEVAISRPNAQTSPSGRIAGSFTVNQIGLYAARDIGVDFPTYTFKVLFGDHYLVAQTAWIGDGAERHQIVSLQLSAMTLGEVLEYFVNLAAPTLGYELTPPWDLLNRVDLSRFTVTIDPTEQTIALTYDVTVDLTIFRVDRIGVRYTRKQGAGSVALILEGAALGQDYTGDDALDWDVVNDSPPDLVPARSAVIDLRYLAFGQHVKVNGIENLSRVAAVLGRMETAMQPVAPDESPIGQPGASGVSFDPDSQWLIGLDIGIAGMLDLGLIFNDPRLYGLSIAMAGPDAGSLAGLYFEILYKKITDSLGVFRIELQLPEAFRHLEFGEVSITLGEVVVEVYTNGNFKIDLGFPHERDFTRSFSVEVFPFIGRGGLYFGLLDGDSSSRVPRISNGFFTPVIGLGVGLAVGVGKDFSIGVLSAGAFIELEVILEGVFARFLPHDAGQDSALYHWIRGVAALHGKIYGKVDFVVIKVNVTLEASATVALTLEAHQPTEIKMDVEVTARASVKVLFVTVHFSFDVSVSFEFEIGRKSTPPWVLAAGGGAAARLVQTDPVGRSSAVSPAYHPASRRRRNVQRALLRGEHLRELHSRGHRVAPATPQALLATAARSARRSATGTAIGGRDAVGETLNWDPTFRVFGTPRRIPLLLLPAFSADGIGLDWTSTIPTTSDPDPVPDYRIVMQLWAATGTTVAPATIAASYARDTTGSAHADTVDELPAAELVELFLRWAIYAVTNPDGGAAAATITAGQLAHLADELAGGTAATVTAFTFDHLKPFLQTNVILSVSGVPAQPPLGFSAMPVALPPVLAFAWSGGTTGAIDLATFNMIGRDYIADIAAYQQRFTPTAAQAGAAGDGAADAVSFASHLFSDWCLMITRAAVGGAQQQLARWSVRPATATTLAAIASDFASIGIGYAVRSGDTVPTVAAALGTTVEELLYLNPGLDSELHRAEPGRAMTIRLGVAPEIIALDNAERTLVPGRFPVDRIGYQVREGDTLSSIASAFGLTSDASLLSDPLLGINPALLRAEASFTAPSTHYTPPAGFGALRSAALFFARFQDTRTLPNRQWYADMIAFWNAAALKGQTAGDAFVPGIALKLPIALGNLTEPALADYVTLAGDTLNTIAAMTDLVQNYPTGPADQVAGWATYRDAMAHAFTSGSDAAAAPALVPTTVTILPGESLAHLAQRSWIFAGTTDPDLYGLLGWVGSASGLLTLHTVIQIDGFTLDTSVYTSFAAAGRALGLDIAALAGRLSTRTIVPAAGADPDWVVTDVPVSGVDALVALVLTGRAFTDITAQSSRQLMAGLRMPAPVAAAGGKVRATGPMTAFASLSGQQFDAPPPGSSTSPGVVITARLDATYDWIVLADSTVAAGDGGLGVHADQAHAVNRRLARDPARVLAAGTLVQLGDVSALDFSYTATQLTDLYPAARLSVTPTAGPTALPLSASVPVTYGLSNRIELQVATPLAMPAPTDPALTGNPSLWPFSATVQALALAASTTPYDLVCAEPEGGGPPAETIAAATWGTLFSIRVQALPGATTLYQLLGTDDVQRQTLLHLWQHLATAIGPAAALSVFVAPDPAATNLQGLAQVAVDPGRSRIMKTNLSTQTVPGLADVHPLFRAQAAAPRDDEAAYLASMAAVPRFLKLLWEGASVGGTGYYLTLSDAAGAGLPATAFTGNGQAVVQLLVITGMQQGAAPAGRMLLPFNTCALVAPGLDPAAAAIYLEAADDSVTRRVAVVPPGNVGLGMTLPMAPTTPISASDRARQLFSIASYSVGAIGATFHADRPGMPITPEARDDGVGSADARRRAARRARARGETLRAVEPSHWRYSQVFPIAQMGPASSAPVVAGLPDPLADPYRGINSGSATAIAELFVGFVDIFGNATAAANARSVPLTVGYTDVLVPFGSWPGLATAYTLATGDTIGTVAIQLGFAQTVATMPGLGSHPESAATLAENQAATWESVYYQLAQPGLELEFASALFTQASGPSAGKPQPVDLSALVPALWRFAAANLLYARAVAALRPERPLSDAAATIPALCRTYGIDSAVLAGAQGGARANDILGSQALVIPAQLAFAQNQSADAIVAAAAARYGWPVPASGTALLTLPQNAEHLPLRPATILAIPDRGFIVPVAATTTLANLAAAQSTTAPLLAEDNAAATDILAEAITIQIDGLSVTTTAPGSIGVRSFADIVVAFAAQGAVIFVGDVAAALADRPDTLIAGAAMVAKRYLVPQPTAAAPFETLAANDSGTTVAALAGANHGTANVFDNGALVYLGDFAGAPAAASDNTANLTEFCNQFNTTPALLFGAMATQSPTPALPQGGALTIPGLLRLPDAPSMLRIPCPVRSADTLAGIAERFAYASGPLDQLGFDNQAMPGLLATGQTIVVVVGGDRATVQTAAGDTIASVLVRLQASVAGVTLPLLMSAIGTQTGLLVDGALLSCPPALLPGTAGSGTTVTAVVTAFGIDGGAFLAANAGLKGLILPGVDVPGPGTTPVTIRTAPADSVTALLARFAVAGVQLQPAELAICAAETPFLASGASALLPPMPLAIAVTVPAAVGPFAEPIVPLQVSLSLSRPHDRIDPAFAQTDAPSPVERFTARIGAPVASSGGGGAGLDQNAFGTQVATLFPALRLMTGRVSGATDDLWLLPFTTSGIASLSVAGVFDPPAGSGDRWPRCFALRPLYARLVTLTGVNLPSLNADGTLETAATQVDMIAVDVEPIARRFLQDLDRLLSAQYAGMLATDPHSSAALLSVMASKKRLVPAVANGLAAVLVETDPGEATAIVAAAERLRQALGAGLADGYATSTVVQYVSTCTSAWTAGGVSPARLLGRAVGRTSSVASTGPRYAISDAKTALGLTTGFVTFLLTVDDPVHTGAVTLDLDYEFSNVEFDIVPIAVGGGVSYDASDWLDFTPLLTPATMPAGVTTRLGTVVAPVPNRSFPQVPTLRSQTAGHDPAPGLAQAATWTYALRYTHEHAAQDEVRVGVRFNQSAGQLRLARYASDDLAAALLSYDAVATGLWDMLGHYADPSSGDAAAAAAAANSFATLAGTIAEAWAAHWPALAAARLAGTEIETRADPEGLKPIDYTFDIAIEYQRDAAGGAQVAAVLVDCDAAGPGPGGAWPSLIVQAADGLPVTTTRTEVGTRRSRYAPARLVPAELFADIAIEWKGIAMADYQNAIASLTVTRNRNLAPPHETNMDFVFATDLVTAPAVVTPIAVEGGRFDITPYGSDLAGALTTAFQTLFGAIGYIGQPVSMEISYGFELSGAARATTDEPLVTYLPIALYPDQVLAASTGATIAAAVDRWRGINRPSTQGGEIMVSLSLYTRISGREQLALLTLDRMVYRLTT